MKKALILSGILASLAMGCGTTSNGSNETTTAATVSNEAAEAAAKEAAAVEAAKVPDAPKSALIAAECKKNIVKMVTKQEGGQQFLLDDSTLWQIMPDGSMSLIKKLPDSVENYSLVPSTDVIIHYTNNKIMMVHVATDTEFFNLAGSAALKTVMFTPDNTEMGILDENSTINIWNVPKRFSGIQISERVQDFINRQSSDYRLRFSTGAYAISLAGNGRAVLASDDEASGKIGLIYYMDDEKNKGVLKAIARTNVHIAHLAISLSANYIAATDTNGQLYVSTTGEDKGFKVYAKRFTDAQNVKFVGDNVLVLGKEKLTLLDVATGFEIWTRDVSARTCYAPTKEKIFCNTGDTIEEINGINGKLIRTLFFNDKTWGELVEGRELKGTADASCIK
ncbi:MAG: hypothetical protein IJU23_06260 [Proteobacteria bacterium]|nr:hypothetical protein [Pseudomonadota bacterium]